MGVFREELYSFWELMIISITFATLLGNWRQKENSSGGSSAR